jgi:glutaredoxin 2
MSKHSFGAVSDVIEIMERVERTNLKGEDKKAAVLSILRKNYPIMFEEHGEFLSSTIDALVWVVKNRKSIQINKKKFLRFFSCVK